MLNNLNQIPALKLLCGILSGYLLCHFLEIPSYWFIYFIAFILIISILLIIKHQTVIAYYLSALLIGILLFNNINSERFEQPRKLIPEVPAVIHGKVLKIINKTDSYCRCIVKGTIAPKILPKIFDKSVLLSVKLKGAYSFNIVVGSTISSNVLLKLPIEGNLPTDFPEKQFCIASDIDFIARSDSRNTAIAAPPDGFLYLIGLMTDRINNTIKKYFSGNNEGIAIALITGDKTGIDRQTKAGFSQTGTSHILSVSGLHVGIIAFMIYLFCGYIPKPWLKFAVFETILILYIFITGFQPSVIRAGVMASAFILAKTLQREANPLNILFFSVILIIIFNPEALISPGFQMSVVSVLGISLFYMKINSQLKKVTNIKSRYFEYLINSISLTIAASITVAPLVANYFELFSIISPLANLIIIPLLSFGMIYTILALLFSIIFSPFASVFAATADFLIDISLRVTTSISQLPYSYISGRYAIIVSVLVSLIIIYLIFSQTKRQFFFRLSYGIITSILIALLFSSESGMKNQIIPRKQYVFASIEVEPAKSILIFADRKPNIRPIRDPAMEKYLENYPGSWIAAVNGTAGKSILKHTKFQQKQKYVQLNPEIQNRLYSQIKSNRKISQIIEYDE
ncbi:MAG: ComEC family competence protein [Ignavibacteria bacterium]|nr:ComEC family competence protein [Ignavibacteria bacterium]